MTTFIRIARTSAARVAALAILALAGSASSALADTLMMPKRDVLAGAPVVIWGVTTKPNGSPISIDFGDGSPILNTTVADRSYINFSRTYATSGIKTVTFTVGGPGPVETASVEIQVFAPSGPTAAEVQRQVRINSAIQDGLRFLWISQSARTTFDTNVATSWGRTSFTALAVLAFENHGYRLPNSNALPAGLYERYAVRRGLNSLLSSFATLPLTPQPAGNPCAGAAPFAEFQATGSCTGYFTAPEGIGLAGYANALMILPFAGSGALNRTNLEAAGVTLGKSYSEITQRLIDAMAFGQNEVSIFNGAGRGGWNYGFNQDRMDGSTAGWNVLAILDAQAAGIPLPSFLVPEFSIGLNNAFNADGSFDYNTDGNPLPAPGGTQNNPTHRNLARGGIGAQGHFLMGGTGTDTRGTAIRNFINSRWTGVAQANDYLETCGGNNQNFGCGYAMFNVFKGLKLLGVQTLPAVNRPAGPGAIPQNDWYAAYQDFLVNTQVAPTNPGAGQWNMGFSCCASSTEAVTALAELILSSVALVLPDADKFAAVGLRPQLATGVESSPGSPSTHTVIARAEGPSPPGSPPGTPGPPVAGATVNFIIMSGPNAGLTFTGVTGADGDVPWTYTDSVIPFPSFGTDQIRASIGTLLSNIVEMVWTPFNRAPVANDDSFTVDEDGVLNDSVLTNDTDADGDTLTAAVVTDVSNGTLVFQNDGSFTYTPNANFCGGDSFTYDLFDGEESSNVATVTIDVTCVNDAPVAVDDTNTTPEDTPVGGTVAPDADVENDALTYANASDPANGAVGLNADGSYTYTPDANFCGTDTFTYEVSDGALTDTGTVTIDVTCVNDAPEAVDDTNTTPEDTTVNGTVAPDADVENDTLTYANASDPANGTVVLSPDGSYTYTPDANFCGTDTFTYEVSDGALTDTGTVTITVTCVNDEPVAVDDANATPEDTPVNGTVAPDTDTDNATLTYENASDPANGSVTLQTDGSYTYTPDANFCGSDSFTYQVSDGTASDTGTVSIAVSCVNDAPVAQNDTFTTNEETAFSGSVTANDTTTDVDGDTLVWTQTSTPTNGTLVFAPNGSFTYTPAPNFCGVDGFSYSLSDGTASSSATVSMTVTCVNDAPVARNDAYSGQWNTALTVPPPGVMTNDSDVDGDPLTAIKVTNPSHGTVVLNANGGFTYMPFGNFSGVDSFTYKVNDGAADSNVATVVITVTSPCFTFKKKHHHHHHGDGDDHDRGRNGHHRGDRCDHDRDENGHDDDDDDYGHHNDDDDDDDHDGGFTICKPGTPKTNPDTYTTKKNTTLTVSASKGVRKNDGPQPTTVELISGPSHGTLTFNANGSFVYKPAPNFTGTDTFYYVARSTGGIASALERVKINVTKTSSQGGHDWDDDRDCDDDHHRGHDRDNKRYGKK